MRIQDMFEKDINREINGVVKVDQDADASLEQELSEYVVTRELAGHFATFYDAYEGALDVPTDKIGVWVSGFFGSGKSHFLKMLSYLLTNRVVAGRAAADYFAGKFPDAMVEAKVRRCAKVPTESILFNVDNKAVGEKDADVLKRTFARVFYDHLGFYGEDLRLARLEQFVESRGLTDAFRQAFERENGEPWLEARAEYEFFSDDVIAALTEAGVMSAEEAQRWFDGSERADISLERLTDEISAYAARRAQECGGQFRLLFMVDEIGQFIGADTTLMLNLQTLVEELGAKCAGRVWVMVTSQEAIDEIAQVAGNDFSKIQGRFDTRLSLSSSSADEVIKRRVLAKTPDAEALLKMQYGQTSAVLKNLFTFEGAAADLGGYEDATDFAETFPFVGYQFTLMQNVMTQIRTHGSSGKHLSSGERSMLSGFQEAAQRVEEKDEHALVPFWLFYDTVETFLEGHVRRVVNRAAEAADHGDQGLEPFDVRVLKLLFLVRWVDDVATTADNVVVLMTDRVDADRVSLREQVQASLDRLVRQNYASRNGETYQFLTDDEQEIARQISRTQVDQAAVVRQIAHVFYGDVFPAPKLQVGENSFPVEEWVDETRVSQPGGLVLRVVTVLADAAAAERTAALMRSGRDAGEALVVLSAEEPYYECIQEAERIERYVTTQNVSNLPESQQRIIREKNQEKTALLKRAAGLIETAVRKGSFYAAGEEVHPAPGLSARRLVEECASRLVAGTYPKLGLVEQNYHADAELRALLTQGAQALPGQEVPNARAADEVDRYLEAQGRLKIAVTMADVLKKFQAAPFGWREIDVAAVVALLVSQGRARLRYAGATVDAASARAVDHLRKKSETTKTQVERRVTVSEATRARAREAVMDFCRADSLPSGEDELARAAADLLEKRATELQHLLDVEYRGHDYPGRGQVAAALDVVKPLVAAGTDPADLLPAIAKADDDLAEAAEDLQDVEGFFTNQRELFDRAARLLREREPERDYLSADAEAAQAMDTIKEIVGLPRPYRRIRELAQACQVVDEAYDELLSSKRATLLDQVAATFEDVRAYAAEKGVELADIARTELERKNAASTLDTLTRLDALRVRLDTDQKRLYAAVDKELDRLHRPAPVPNPTATVPGPAAGTAAAEAPRPKVASVDRVRLCPPKRLSNESEVNAYVEKIRAALLAALEGSDAVRVS